MTYPECAVCVDLREEIRRLEREVAMLYREIAVAKGEKMPASVPPSRLTDE